MGITMLKMDRAKVKWRVKLERAFEGKRQSLGFFRYFCSHVFPLALIFLLRRGRQRYSGWKMGPLHLALHYCPS